MSIPSLLSRNGQAFPYRVTVSPRARRVSIRVSPRDGVRVTVPRRHDLREVERFVHSRRDWIAKHLGRFAALRRATPRAHAARPDTIELPAIGERWTVSYRETAAGSVTVRDRAGADVELHAAKEPDGDRPQLALFPPVPVVIERELHVSGAVGHTTAVRAALRRWLRVRATAALLPWLDDVSRETGLPYVRATVRGQRTRWGSCTAQGAISLNAQLLLLPRDAARYVLVHELAHTRQLNHSARFWNLVARHEPDYAALRLVLQEAGARMPAWVEGGGVMEDNQS